MRLTGFHSKRLALGSVLEQHDGTCLPTKQTAGVRDIATQYPKLSPDKALEMWLLSGRARVAALNTAEPNYVESLGAGTIQTP
jgi:hypothetical protein